MLVLDVVKFHSTPEVPSTLRSNNIIPSLVPAGCTSLVQPLDVAINKPFKDILEDILDRRLDEYEESHSINLREIPSSNTNMIAEQRVLVSWSVGEAWETFNSRYQQLVITTFQKLGLTLPIDGSSDQELMVKGIKPSTLQIGDWSRQTGSRDGLGSGVEEEGQVRAQCNQGETGLASTAEVKEEAEEEAEEEATDSTQYVARF